jgi:DHA1 family multidrug resistance protein-like MFS transporter
VQTLIILRFFSGVFGSSSLNNVPATIGQIVKPASQGKYMIFYALSAFGGPGLGPLLAGFIDHRAGFRWNLRVQAIFVAATTIACILFVPETGEPSLRKKALPAVEGVKEPSRRDFVLATSKRALLGPFIWLTRGEETSQCCKCEVHHKLIPSLSSSLQSLWC